MLTKENHLFQCLNSTPKLTRNYSQKKKKKEYNLSYPIHFVFSLLRIWTTLLVFSPLSTPFGNKLETASSVPHISCRISRDGGTSVLTSPCNNPPTCLNEARIFLTSQNFSSKIPPQLHARLSLFIQDANPCHSHKSHSSKSA